jgi:uncharacterized protein YjaG (DUF416 family)
MQNLAFNRNLVFGYLTSKRLLPNYIYFSNKYSFGDAKVLEDYLGQLRRLIIYPKEDNYIRGFENAINAATPEPHEFDTVLASSAVDACGSVYELLCYATDGDQSHIDSIRTFATDSIDMYVQELFDLDMNLPDSETKIASHPLMIREKEIQNHIWQYLTHREAIDEGDLQMLEDLQFNGGRGNLNLSLDE